MLIIIVNALLWASLPALISSWITVRLIESRSTSTRREVTTPQLYRAAEVFGVWLLIFTAVFSALIWHLLRSAG